MPGTASLYILKASTSIIHHDITEAQMHTWVVTRVVRHDHLCDTQKCKAASHIRRPTSIPPHVFTPPGTVFLSPDASSPWTALQGARAHTGHIRLARVTAIAADKELFTLDHSNPTADTDIAEITLSQVHVNCILNFPDGNCCRQRVVHLRPFQFHSWH